ncbi:bifunctional glycosyltransferase/CDP-glycerol:glycerophosphate glycerophosphotransferase [Actinomadura opuntiae]|uniref:bifunctional glycosyltransferase/CDP-glycerol:glycerophosphate glycerophosphotransferase n=1 Tax=Actinomadura sp. OS1-43 TaxID=604315 RepID=UPI00255B34CB|nr:bifunctional glycosyltransferase/CDP-glycerol:glycerophosphate glycerophosphotransferase [Actinomadura sp. OS1-43]MDL4814843.1 CDP-glycerol glycerophosphotransferase family protein [Actinomadura sp. OS1-43]
MSPKISVVVPFRTAEDHLAGCLESLAGQTLRDLEVIMVDDGAGEGAAAVAKRFADRDGRFRLVQHADAGGPARNTGLRHAEGRYLAFVDGEDAVPPYAYELLVGSMESTGSDIAGGNVMCLDDEGVWQSWMHAEPYAATIRSTHVAHHPVLLLDRTVWNKVFRRSFWDAHQFEFPAMQYEDVTVAMETHVLASSVDVLDTTVYFWRHHPGAYGRERQELGDIIDRMAALGMVRRVLRDRVPELLPAHDMYALDLDLRALVHALPAASEQERRRLVDLGAEIVASADPSAASGLEAIKRLELHLLGERMLPELLEVLRFEEGGLEEVPIVPKGRIRQRWYARYPFFGDERRAIPDEVYDVTDEFDLWTQVERAGWDGEILTLEGYAHFARLDVSSAHDSRIRMWLRDARTGQEVRLETERTRCPDATARSGQALVSYEWSGFAVRVDPEALRDGEEWRTAAWELFAEVSTAGHKAVRRITAAAPRVRWTAPRQPAEHVAVQPADGDGGFVVHVKNSRAVLTGFRRTGDSLELTGWTNRALGAGAAIMAARRHGGAEVFGDVTVRPAAVTPAAEGTGFCFTATLPLDGLLSLPAGEPVPETSARPHLLDAIDWDIRLNGEGGPLRLTMAGHLGEARYARRGREFVLTRTAYGNLRGVERSFRPVVTRAAWDAEGRLALAGAFADPEDRPGRLLLRCSRSGDTHEMPLAWEGDRFIAAFTPARLPVFGTDLPLAEGTWDLIAPTRSGDVAVVVERAAIPALPEWRRVGTHEYEVGVHQTDAVQLHSRPALSEDERGRHAQRLLQLNDYPVYLRSGLSDVVVFDSYNASQYSCNPRALYEELAKRRPDLECVWVSQDGQFAVEGEARTVLAGTREHYRTLARARYIVTNYGAPHWYIKREGQIYLQTWHGTPLKRLGYDLKDMPYRRTEKLDWIQREVPRWSYLLSPSPFATDVMRHAFHYSGRILETGYPRNDVMSTPEWQRLGTDIRKRLGIPEGKKVVLYAPTWRDDEHHAMDRRGFHLELDLETMRRVLGGDHVLLLRAHYLITDRAHVACDDFVMDVTRYPDVADLYMAADVLVTDYSSAMFDYAVLGRPMVFYTYDLERYRDHVRGFYLDLEAEAPGPLAATSEEVAEAVRAAPEMEDEYSGKYDDFFVKYCPHDDGEASTRVIDQVFSR